MPVPTDDDKVKALEIITVAALTLVNSGMCEDNLAEDITNAVKLLTGIE